MAAHLSRNHSLRRLGADRSPLLTLHTQPPMRKTSVEGRYSTTPTLFFAILKLKGKTLHQAVEMDIDIARNLQHLEEEDSEEFRGSEGALNQCILSLIAMLGLLLQVKQAGQAAGSKSPFETDHVLMMAFIANFLIYIGSLATVKTLQFPTSDLAEFINNISVLFGFLAAILLLFILVPAFGWCTLGLWIVYFLRDVVTKKSYSWALLSVLNKVRELFKGQDNFEAESVVQIPDTGVLQTTVVQIQDEGEQNVR